MFKYACCYWGITYFLLSQWTEFGNLYMVIFMFFYVHYRKISMYIFPKSKKSFFTEYFFVQSISCPCFCWSLVWTFPQLYFGHDTGLHWPAQRSSSALRYQHFTRPWKLSSPLECPLYPHGPGSILMDIELIFVSVVCCGLDKCLPSKALVLKLLSLVWCYQEAGESQKDGAYWEVFLWLGSCAWRRSWLVGPWPLPLLSFTPAMR